MAPNILKAIATGQGKEKVVIVDARKAMDSLECPLFLLPFSKELIMDIVMGRVLMFMMLDLDGFLSLYDYRSFVRHILPRNPYLRRCGPSVALNTTTAGSSSPHLSEGRWPSVTLSASISRKAAAQPTPQRSPIKANVAVRLSRGPRP